MPGAQVGRELKLGATTDLSVKMPTRRRFPASSPAEWIAVLWDTGFVALREIENPVPLG